MNKGFSFFDRVRSFRFALIGLLVMLRDQHNARIHLLATVLVVSLAFYLNLAKSDWISLLFCIALVWLAEAMNSALEYLCDAVVPDEHPLIGKCKDVAAAGVLICAVVAAGIGALVFLPYL